ncbi:MAG: PHP domain-containing protein, partial [Acidimicrobiia bacterium]|nr:PHP domain-containing protein [Acidimicrobiia bacterium]
MARYAELHCHSNFSFLDGASHPDALVERAVALGYEALAITDHDGFYGAPRFRLAAAEAGLATVYGVEVGLPRAGSRKASPPATRYPPPAREDGDWREAGSGKREAGARRGRTHRLHGTKPTAIEPSDHLVLLAPDPRGYAALSRLVTRAQFRGEKDRAVYDQGELVEASGDGRLVALTGCHRGEVSRHAAAGDLAGAMGAAARLREVFPGRLFIELWDHRMPGDDLRNDVAAEVAGRLRLPTIATNHVHYHDRSESDIAEVLAAIGGRRDLAAGYGHWPATDE